MRNVGLLSAVLVGCAFCGIDAARAVDIPIAGLKLVVVDRTLITGTRRRPLWRRTRL